MPQQNRRKSAQTPVSSSDRAKLDLVRKKGPRATCFFNNKGGVGKTTLVANLAAELSLNFSAKVLVIDADPQCNLTQYVLGEDVSLDIYSKDDPASVYSVIRPLALGKGYNDKLPIRRSEDFGFDLIIGDPRLALQEDLLAQDWRDAKSGGMRGLRTTFVFADVVRRAKKMSYDFIFFDMGPSLGAINRSILLAMDYFLVPMSIDIFSVWAIKNIGTTVSVWQKELKTGVSLAEDPQELQEIQVNTNLRFVGYVTQQHKERGGSEPDPSRKGATRKRIVQAYKDISEDFPDQIAKNFGALFSKSKIDPHLGNIRHLGSLAPKSQSQHLPMISVKGASYAALRKQAREIYRQIANRYLENLTAT